MFEKILEKILLNYFGKYLTGFDKNNLKLGVWSGNVVIENMQLKPDVIANMELPLDIQHSMIGRLVIKVPWTKLSSAPVEVLIEDVLLVVKPKDPRNWNFSDEWKIQKKFNVLLNYAQEQMEKFLNKKKKKDAEDAGYFNKLTLKVLDNIQLQVKNIHLRWEANSAESPHAWGIRMDDLDAYTTNSEWNKFYIDRTDEKNKLTPMNKILQVSNLRVYWNSVETSFFQQYTPPELLYQDIDEIININAKFKLVQNVKSSFDQSLNEIFIDLEWIALTMKHAQLQQMILMMETISLYTKLLWVERKTVKAVQYDKQDYQDKFQNMFGSILRSEQKELSILSKEEQVGLNDILQSVEYDLLLEWVRGEVSSIILESKVQEMQKQKSKKGWFGWGATQIIEDDTNTNDQDIREIQQFIDATLLENETQAISIIRPSNSIRYTVKFELKGASILLLKEYSDLGGSIDGLRLTLQDLRFSMESQQNTDWKSNFVLQDIELELMQKDGYVETQYTALCYVLERQNPQTGFTTFSLSKCTASKTDTAAADLVIKCRVEPVTWIYNASLVRIFREMKKVKKGNIDEALKSATWERLERLQDGTQSKLQVLMASTLRIDMDIEVEKFRVLLPVEGGAGWQFYIERGQMRSCDQSSEDLYDRFVVQVKEASFVHGIAEGAVGRAQGIQWTTETFLVERYSLDLEFSRLKSSIKMVVRGEDEDVPSLVVDLKLKKLKLSLTEKSYSELVYLPEAIFPILNQNERLELMQEEKASIMSSSTKSGWLKRRGDHIRVWTRTYVVLSGAYLYFYDNETSMVASLTLYIKNSTIERLDSTLEEQEQHSFSIINRYAFSYLALESEQTLTEWMSVLNRKIEEFTTENQFLRRSSIKAQKNLTQAIRGPLVKLVGCMEKVELVMHKDNQSQLLHLMVEGLEFMWRRSSARQNYLISMRRLFVEDWVFELACPANQALILMEAVDKCLELEIITTMPNHSEYNKIDMQVKCRIEKYFTK